MQLNRTENLGGQSPDINFNLQQERLFAPLVEKVKKLRELSLDLTELSPEDRQAVCQIVIWQNKCIKQLRLDINACVRVIERQERLILTAKERLTELKHRVDVSTQQLQEQTAAITQATELKKEAENLENKYATLEKDFKELLQKCTSTDLNLQELTNKHQILTENYESLEIKREELEEKIKELIKNNENIFNWISNRISGITYQIVSPVISPLSDYFHKRFMYTNNELYIYRIICVSILKEIETLEDVKEFALQTIQEDIVKPGTFEQFILQIYPMMEAYLFKSNGNQEEQEKKFKQQCQQRIQLWTEKNFKTESKNPDFNFFDEMAKKLKSELREKIKEKLKNLKITQPVSEDYKSLFFVICLWIGNFEDVLDDLPIRVKDDWWPIQYYIADKFFNSYIFSKYMRFMEDFLVKN